MLLLVELHPGPKASPGPAGAGMRRVQEAGLLRHGEGGEVRVGARGEAGDLGPSDLCEGGSGKPA